MENVLSNFSADNLEIKLTSEKLFINTAVFNETFALRSLNGIGVVDLVDEYNKALTEWEKYRLTNKVFIGLGIIFWLVGLWGFQDSISSGLTFIIVGSICGIPALIGINKTQNEPKLMSAVRIMMSGGNWDFNFDKTGIKSGNVAEFVSLVESTLTSYHKNYN